MVNCIFVGIGGFIGSVCRYLVGLIPLKEESGFPIKTLLINISGAFILGLIVALALKRKSFQPHLLLMLKVGICGGFTTFSTFALETTTLLQSGRLFPALLYMLLSVAGGVLAVYGAGFLVP
jgi:CrcB protein